MNPSAKRTPQGSPRAEQLDQRFEGEGQQHGGEQGDEDGGGEVQEGDDSEDCDDGRTRPYDVQILPRPPSFRRPGNGVGCRGCGLRGFA